MSGSPEPTAIEHVAATSIDAATDSQAEDDAEHFLKLFSQLWDKREQIMRDQVLRDMRRCWQLDDYELRWVA